MRYEIDIIHILVSFTIPVTAIENRKYRYSRGFLGHFT